MENQDYIDGNDFVDAGTITVGADGAILSVELNRQPEDHAEAVKNLGSPKDSIFGGAMLAHDCVYSLDGKKYRADYDPARWDGSLSGWQLVNLDDGKSAFVIGDREELFPCATSPDGWPMVDDMQENPLTMSDLVPVSTASEIYASRLATLTGWAEKTVQPLSDCLAEFDRDLQAFCTAIESECGAVANKEVLERLQGGLDVWFQLKRLVERVWRVVPSPNGLAELREHILCNAEG